LNAGHSRSGSERGLGGALCNKLGEGGEVASTDRLGLGGAVLVSFLKAVRALGPSAAGFRRFITGSMLMSTEAGFAMSGEGGGGDSVDVRE